MLRQHAQELHHGARLVLPVLLPTGSTKTSLMASWAGTMGDSRKKAAITRAELGFMMGRWLVGLGPCKAPVTPTSDNVPEHLEGNSPADTCARHDHPRHSRAIRPCSPRVFGVLQCLDASTMAPLGMIMREPSNGLLKDQSRISVDAYSV